MANVFIYALKDPDTGQIRYIGVSGDPIKRLKRHLNDKEKNHRTNWIRSLDFGGMVPVLVTLDEVPESERQQWEVAYIEYFRECGCDLVNGTPGGDGVGRGKDHPQFGIKQSPELVEKRASKIRGEKNGMYGKPGTMLGKKLSSARIKRMCGSGNPMFGIQHSDEWCSKHSAAMEGEGNPMFGIVRLGESAPNFGRKFSTEWCANISASKTGANHPRFGKKDSRQVLENKRRSAKLREEKKRQAAILAEMWD